VVRRVLAGLIAGAVGAPVYLYFRNEAGWLAAGAVMMGVYQLIDWLGVLPPPYDLGTHSLLHRDDNQPH